ncbi:hypothetical protein Moror_4037 [Moniliophthora roreri MCA 2997]|uniref:Meiotically up-regulated protein Msb1/Mug8 domain-containing protein n=1 Tax=Moniliophthora roreri (strain MCA 2997) TaxID=1381753 RepID=V2XE74_MONRO|nr:hypothetical protein Moror_4037 [Moniliophthora roreri MCA 2997]
MPSIFSRSRTGSTPYPSSPDSPLGPDEFGRAPSRQSTKGSILGGSATKKERKKAAKEQAAAVARIRTMSGVQQSQRGDSMYSLSPVGGDIEGGDPIFQYGGVFVQEGAFLPTILEKPTFDTGTELNRSLNSSVSSAYSTVSSISSTASVPTTMDHGYLAYQRHVVLSPENVARLVEVVCEELGTRGGITTPFIFSTLALDISPTRIKRLIDSFLATCPTGRGGTDEADRRWREEAKFSGMHELGMVLRWGLARLVRVCNGQEMRGFISWELYTQWREEEEALLYPPTHFTTLLPSLQPAVQNILLTVLSLLARLTANSATSGHTPPTLSPLFGPLIFGLGAPSLPFHHTYIYYLRSVNALEHILLAFVRWQDNPRTATNVPNPHSENMLGSVATLGVPRRLKEWIKGYPAMLPHLQSGSSANRKDSFQHKRPEPRKGSRTVRVMSIRRNVRDYDKDLVKNGANWSRKPPPPTAAGAQSSAVNLSLTGVLAESKEWERISPKTGKSGDRHSPKYTEAYRKRMNFPSNLNPDSGMGPSSTSSSGANSPTTGFVYGLTAVNGDKEPKQDFLGVGLGLTEGEDRFKSLTDLKWGEFESLGFGGLGTGGEGDKKLEFDLTEGARNERARKRQTLGWDDFSTAGFSRTDAPLSATLQFSQPLTATIERWPQERAEIGKKLKKREKALPPFGWDTSPIIGGEEVIEEAFVDVFCDLIWGSGWGEGLAGMSGAREQQGKIIIEDRECCWALVEFKSLPTSRPQISSPVKPTDDPRVAGALVLFEEFVPLEYRQQLLELSTGSRRRLPSLFTPSKKQWKQAATLNGRPYVVGHVPRSPSYREMEFEGLLRGEGNRETKLLSLSTSVKVPKKDAQDVFRLDRVASATPALPRLPSTDRPAVTTNEPQQSFKRASPQPPASEETHSDSTLQSPSAQKEKKSKFKLPVSPAVTRSRSAGIPPAEYSTVDFETRLRGYSDDSNGSSSLDDLVYGDDEDLGEAGKRRRQDRLREHQRKKDERREKRMSRDPDDAWVDILVGTQERRMAGQDAEMRPRDRAAIRDPEAASLEVQQALAAVQNRQFSPSDDEDDHLQKKRVLNEPRPYGDDDDDLDEIETVPRRERPDDPVRDSYTSYTDGDSAYQGTEPVNERYSYTDGDEEDPEPAPAPPKKRPGYFDLHPERRPVSMLDDDPRERAQRKYQDSDDEDDAENYATPAAPTPAVASPAVPSPAVPSPAVPSPAAASPAITTSQGHVRPLPVIPPKTSVPAPPEAPATNGKNHDSESSTITVSQPAPKPLPSKTAALIEMYREKEKSTPAPGIGGAPNAASQLPSSKIPVRTSSKPELPTPPASAQQQQQQPPKSPSPPALAEPPKIPPEENGRASPARYVHGAPLHNVLEEEEEEEEEE